MAKLANTFLWEKAQGSTKPVWGDITGDINKQHDLQDNFNEKIGFKNAYGVNNTFSRLTPSLVGFDAATKPDVAFFNARGDYRHFSAIIGTMYDSKAQTHSFNLNLNIPFGSFSFDSTFQTASKNNNIFLYPVQNLVGDKKMYWLKFIFSWSYNVAVVFVDCIVLNSAFETVQLTADWTCYLGFAAAKPIIITE